MQAYKGLGVLLDAARILVSEEVGFHLVLAGRGESLTALKQQFEALKDVTIIDQFVSAERVINELRRCSTVVLPYLDATQSGVAAAAFANRRSVVASSVGGLVDVVKPEENGILVPPSDPTALAAALRRVIQEPNLLEKLSAGAVESSTGAMSWAVGARETARFCEEVLARS
jgi:glycosyltransferase involved in cell wall biosynthesis